MTEYTSHIVIHSKSINISTPNAQLPLPVQSVPITNKVVSWNPDHGEVYSMQLYFIKFVNDLRQIGGILRVLMLPPTLKLTATR